LQYWFNLRIFFLMAKNTGIFRFSGTLGGLVFSNGSNGQIVRVKRGTYKPAAINKVLSANAGRSAYINGVASPLYRLLCAIATINRDGSAWARILSRLKSCASDEPLVLLERLRDLDMHERYPLSRCWMAPKATVSSSAKRLLVQMGNTMAPRFNRVSCNQYRYQLSALFRSSATGQWKTDAACTEWFDKRETDNAYEFAFNRPAGNGVCVLCLCLEAGCDGKPVNSIQEVRVSVLGAWEY